MCIGGGVSVVLGTSGKSGRGAEMETEGVAVCLLPAMDNFCSPSSSTVNPK